MRSAVQDLVDATRRIAARGWMPATSGNLSRRTPQGGFVVTASGVDKAALGWRDIVHLGPDGAPAPGSPKASAETGLHLARYRVDGAVGAVIHHHAPNAVLASRRFGDAVVLEGFELLKAFAGTTTHEARLVVPIVENHQDMDVLGPRAEAAVAASGPTWGYLVRGHGLYTWGPDLPTAERHAEALDQLLHYALEEARW